MHNVSVGLVKRGPTDATASGLVKRKKRLPRPGRDSPKSGKARGSALRMDRVIETSKLQGEIDALKEHLHDVKSDLEGLAGLQHQAENSTCAKTPEVALASEGAGSGASLETIAFSDSFSYGSGSVAQLTQELYLHSLVGGVSPDSIQRGKAKLTYLVQKTGLAKDFPDNYGHVAARVYAHVACEYPDPFDSIGVRYRLWIRRLGYFWRNLMEFLSFLVWCLMWPYRHACGNYCYPVCGAVPVLKRDQRITDHCPFEHVSDAFDGTCEHSGTFTRGPVTDCSPKEYDIGFSIGQDSVWLPRKCQHSEEVAVIKRQLLPPLGTPEVRQHQWNRAFAKLSKKLHRPELTLTGEEMIAKYREHLNAPKRRAFDYALDKLDKWGDLPDVRSKNFTKLEVGVGKTSIHKLHARLISGKSDEYLALTGPEYYCWTKELGKLNWSCTDEHLLSLDVWPRLIYAGSYRAEHLGAFVSFMELSGYNAYEFDFSRYDGHTEVEALKSEFKFYSGQLSERLLELLSAQLKTSGSCPLGTRFKVRGKRASGVINTTMGNTLCGLALYNSILEDMGVKDYYVVQLGDDSMVFTREALLVSEVVERCEAFGHKLEGIDHGNTSDSYDRLSFCSALFWNIGSAKRGAVLQAEPVPGPHRIMGPKPFRCLAKTFIPTQRLNPSHMSSHLGGVALGFKHYKWIPVLGEVCDLIMKHHRPGRAFNDVNPYKLSLTREYDVDESAVYAQFLSRYGVRPEIVMAVLRQNDFSHVSTSVEHHVLEACLQVDGVERIM